MIENLYLNEDSDYIKKNPTWHTEDSPWKASQIEKILSKNQIKFKTIGEIGCGAGEILKQLQTLYSQFDVSFHGFEISPYAYSKAKLKEGDGLTFYLSNLLNDDHFFDILLIIDVIEHVPNYYEFIDKLKIKAKYKVFHIPLEMSVISILRNKPLDAKRSVGHLHFFSKDTALEVLKDNGLNIIDYYYTHGALETPNKPLRTRFLNYFRKVMFHISPDLTVRLLGGYSLLVVCR